MLNMQTLSYRQFFNKTNKIFVAQHFFPLFYNNNNTDNVFSITILQYISLLTCVLKSYLHMQIAFILL